MGQGTPNPIVQTPAGIREIRDWQEIESKTLSQYYRDIHGNIVNANSAFFYDTAVIKTGVAVTANAKKSLFTLGKSETDTQFGTSTTTGEKTEFLTNMVSNGMFDDSTNFIMEGAGVQVIETADSPTTVAANGAVTAPDYTASTTVSGANNLYAILNNLELRFIRGEEIKKRGLLLFWPAPPGIGMEGNNGSPNGGFFQNGRGGLVQFDHPVVLGGGDRFQFDLANVSQNSFTPTMWAIVRVVLWGTLIRPSYPY